MKVLRRLQVPLTDDEREQLRAAARRDGRSLAREIVAVLRGQASPPLACNSDDDGPAYDPLSSVAGAARRTAWYSAYDDEPRSTRESW